MRGTGGKGDGCSKRKEGKTRKKAEKGKLTGKGKQRKERLRQERNQIKIIKYIFFGLRSLQYVRSYYNTLTLPQRCILY
jgi:hypothetical protein